MWQTERISTPGRRSWIGFDTSGAAYRCALFEYEIVRNLGAPQNARQRLGLRGNLAHAERQRVQLRLGECEAIEQSALGVHRARMVDIDFVGLENFSATLDKRVGNRQQDLCACSRRQGRQCATTSARCLGGRAQRSNRHC